MVVTPVKTVKAEAMKRPQHPFFQFVNEKRPEIMAAGAKITEVPGKAKEMFGKLSPEEKKAYDDRYEEQKKAYEAFLKTDAGKELLAEKKDAKEVKKHALKDKSAKAGKKAEKKAAKDAAAGVPEPEGGVPKRPSVPLFHFINEKRKELMAAGAKMTEVPGKAKEMFEKLSAEEKKPYEDMHEKQKKATEEFNSSEVGKKYRADVQMALKQAKKDQKAAAKEEAKEEKKEAKEARAKKEAKPKEAKPEKEGRNKRKKIEADGAAPKAEKQKKAPPPKKFKRGQQPTATLSEEMVKEAAAMETELPHFKTLLERLLGSEGISGMFDERTAFDMLKKTKGNLNQARNQLKGI